MCSIIIQGFVHFRTAIVLKMNKRIDSKVLVIDDDADVVRSLQLYLHLHFTTVKGLENPSTLNEVISDFRPEIILLDMNFKKAINDGREGLYWLRHIKEQHSEIVVILLTAYANIDLAVESLKMGASDFVVKPWDNQKLLSSMLRALELSQSKRSIKQLKKVNRHLGASVHPSVMESKSPLMQSQLELARRAASTDANVLLLGESGTGKLVMAHYIHLHSERSHLPFVQLDLGAVAPSLFESELFGHKKGAFTGAQEDKKGRLEMAEGGTLFLDEIGNLPGYLQSKLLTLIQNKTFVPLGGNTTHQLNCRLIFATNARLEEAVKAGTFRQDLYFRINTITLNLPPLRNRAEDISILGEYFLAQNNRKYKTEKRFEAQALTHMHKHQWPGNIRELEHLIERAIILSEGPEINPMLFVQKSAHLAEGQGDTWRPMSLEYLEKQHIEQMLEHFERNISKAAKTLNINRNTLYSKIDKYGL